MVLIHMKIKSNPLKRGIFFAFLLGFLIVGNMFAISGCNAGNQSATKQDEPSNGSDDEFILMGYRANVLEKSLELIRARDDFSSSDEYISTYVQINNAPVPVQIDTQNAYPCAYPDNRMFVYYPLTTIRLPNVSETIPIGFIHYFDDKQMNAFFHVISSISTDEGKITEVSDAPPSSEYGIVFQSLDGLQYGIAGSRILNKSDLTDEEAFRKFDTSSRKVLVGTNSKDENKFLFIFVKIPGWDNRLFQIFYRWF